MRGMKITVDAAMRARDVSQPRADQEARAQVAEPEPAVRPARPRPEPATGAAPAVSGAVPAVSGPAGLEVPQGQPKARRPHRRRRHRLWARGAAMGHAREAAPGNAGDSAMGHARAGVPGSQPD
jgi:hypothetical protein